MPTDAIGQVQNGITEVSANAGTKILGSGKASATESTGSPQPSNTATAVQPGKAALEAIAKQVQQALTTADTGLQFSVDNSTGKTVVKVVHEESGEVIRQIPNEEVMAISRNIGKMQGLLFEKKA